MVFLRKSINVNETELNFTMIYTQEAGDPCRNFTIILQINFHLKI